MKINMHTSHPSAFISSTFNDLQKERVFVANTLRERGLNINALDIKPASNDSSKKEIINGIRESDFIILIIGDRYGSIIPDLTGSKTLSITKWEYQRGIGFGKPVLAYFKHISSFDDKNHDNKTESNYKMKRILLEKFKKLIATKHNPAYFADPYELSEKVQNSLIPVYRSGVKHLLLKNAELLNKIVELETELTKLR